MQALRNVRAGEPIYVRMGYREITRFPWFVLMPASSEGPSARYPAPDPQ